MQIHEILLFLKYKDQTDKGEKCGGMHKDCMPHLVLSKVLCDALWDVSNRPTLWRTQSHGMDAFQPPSAAPMQAIH